jgi:hypothetical protein
MDDARLFARSTAPALRPSRWLRAAADLGHITSNTRTPSSRGVGASHGEACKAVRALEIPCCHRISAAKCYELAKGTSPTFLSGFYRQAAMQFLFMAEGELKVAERQTRRRDK